MPAALIALLIGALPILAVHLAYAISIAEEFVPACVPYWEGCTSISRAARHGNALFLFRGIVMPCCALMVLYWRITQLWLCRLDNTRSFWGVFLLGAIGSTFLILYTDYLGSSGDSYRFMRRYGIFMFFGLTPLAQLLQVNALLKLCASNNQLLQHRPLIRLQLAFCCVMLLCGLASVGADWLGMKTYEFGNVLEWVFALLIFSFFLVTALIWQRSSLQLSLLSDR